MQPHQLLEELRKILNETLPKSIRLRIDDAPDARTIVADPTQLHQVLMNLCINARDAMPDGGELTVAVANVELDEHDATTNGKVRPGPYVVFSVTDNGTGMTPEIRERIFDPFTTKEIGKNRPRPLHRPGNCQKPRRFHQSRQQTRSRLLLQSLSAGPDRRPTRRGKAAQETAILRGNNELIMVVDDEAPVRNIAKRP